jgi:hypothetical protein
MARLALASNFANLIQPVSSLDANGFDILSGDPFRTAGMKAIERLLDGGVKVALVYGDRDCPYTHLPCDLPESLLIIVHFRPLPLARR